MGRQRLVLDLEAKSYLLHTILMYVVQQDNNACTFLSVIITFIHLYAYVKGVTIEQV